MAKHLNKKNIALSLAAALWAGCDGNNATSAEKCIDEKDCKELSGEISEGGMVALYGVAPIFDPITCDVKGECTLPEQGCEERIFENFKTIDEGCEASSSKNPDEATCSATSIAESRVIKEVCADGSITTKDSLNYETGAHFVNGVQVNPEEDCKPVYTNYAVAKVQANDAILEDKNAEEKFESTEPVLSCEEQLDQVDNAINNLKDSEIEAAPELLDSLYSQRDSLEANCLSISISEALYGVSSPIVSRPESLSFICADERPITPQKYKELLEEYMKNNKQ